VFCFAHAEAQQVVTLSSPGRQNVLKLCPNSGVHLAPSYPPEGRPSAIGREPQQPSGVVGNSLASTSNPRSGQWPSIGTPISCPWKCPGQARPNSLVIALRCDSGSIRPGWYRTVLSKCVAFPGRTLCRKPCQLPPPRQRPCSAPSSAVLGGAPTFSCQKLSWRKNEDVLALRLTDDPSGSSQNSGLNHS
jgi:hypothetical protein